MPNAIIKGIGFYVPPRVVTNFELEQYMDTSDQWIRERSGIITRHFVEEGVGTYDLAYEASMNALQDAKMTPKDIDFIIFATLSPSYEFPGDGVFLQTKLGIADKGIGALDIRVQCTGFIYGLAIANNFIKTGQYKNILLVGAEIHSTGMDLSTAGRDTAVLFGDGAGAVIVSAIDNTNRGIITTHLHSDGRYAKELWCEGPGSIFHPRVSKEMLDERKQFPYMNGREVFVNAVTKFPETINEALTTADYKMSDIDLLIVHQANLRIAQAVQKKLGLPDEKIYNNIQKYGNTTAASIPIALCEAKELGKVKEGNLICLAAFGSGFTWGSALLRW